MILFCVPRLRILLLLVVGSLVAACAAFKGPLYAQGKIGEEVVAADMDSEIAKFSLQPSSNEPVKLKRFRRQLEHEVSGIPSNEELRNLVQQGSVDFATVVYARALLDQPRNRHWQTQSYQLSTRLDSLRVKNSLQLAFSHYHALLIPGWHWRSRPETGADLSYPRKILASYGLQSTLVETNEHGSVEDNGVLVAQAVHDAKMLNKSIVLVSASKGGADTAYALGALLDIEQTPYLKGWLNIGGIIAGSTLIDHALEDPVHWLSWLGLPEDTPLTALRSLSTQDASARLVKLKFPDSLTIINYAALPFTSHLNDKSRYSYTRLAHYGPNDGAALIPEMLVPGGHTVLEFGLDHYMRSPRAMRRAIALLMMIMDCELESVCE